MGPDKSVHSPEYGIVYIQKVHFQQKGLYGTERCPLTEILQ